MRFQVPQFIETETKIVGPLTWKQFIWVALGVGLLHFLVRLLNGPVLIFVSMVVIAVFGSLAFIRIEETALIEYLMKALSFALSPKKYLFKKENSQNF